MEPRAHGSRGAGRAQCLIETELTREHPALLLPLSCQRADLQHVKSWPASTNPCRNPGADLTPSVTAQGMTLLYMEPGAAPHKWEAKSFATISLVAAAGSRTPKLPSPAARTVQTGLSFADTHFLHQLCPGSSLL